MGNPQSSYKLGNSHHDSSLCCIACGILIKWNSDEAMGREREDWRRAAKWRKNFIVPAAELEHMTFKKNRSLWSSYYRAILIEPQGGHYLSGIARDINSFYCFRYVPTDPHRARIFGSGKQKRCPRPAFYMTELVMDARRDQSKERIGYAIHAHCWVLVDRVIGQDIVQKHLRKFTLAAQAYWVRNSDDWRAMPDHPIHDVLCYGPQEIDWHMVLFYPRSLGSPLRMQGMRKLIAQATRGDPRVNLRGNSVILDLPLDIAILVIDLIFKRPRCRERLSDINSLLEALQWKLPDTYWKARCEYWFLFEIDDLIKENRAVNWKRLCLAMEELLLDKIWYCNSGLKARQQALMSLEGIKEYFLGMIDSST